MIGFDYAARHLRGVWRLAAGDETWREGMDLSTEGVFASFWAIAFSAPFAIVGILVQYKIAEASPAFPSSLYAQAPMALMAPVDLLSSLAAWLMTVAVLALAAKQLGAARETAALIVSFNWSQLLAFITVMAPAIAIAATGNAELSSLLFFGVLVFSIYLFWMVIRRNLPISVAIAIALIVGLSAASFGVYTILTNIAVRLYQLFS